MTEQDTTQVKNVVPGSFAQLGVTTKYTFLDYLRSRRFFVLLGIDLIISVLLTIVIGYYRPADVLSSSLSFYSSWWGLSTTFVIVLSGIFFGGDAISSEFQNKTGYFTVPNPIRRSSIYLGKWLAALIASTIILGIFAAITIGNGVYYFGLSIPYQFGEALLFSWIYLVTVLGFCFFFSSLFKSSTTSILLTAILLLFGFTLIDAVIVNIVKIEPWFSLTYGAGIISNVLSSPYPPHKTTTTSRFGRGLTTLTSYNATVPEGLLILGVYFIVTIILGLVLFENKDFT